MASYAKAVRVNIPDAITSFVIPNLKRAGAEKKIIIKNVGTGLFANTLRFNFEGDGVSNYITLAPGERSEIFGGLRGGETVYTDGVNGSTTAEILIWEE